MENQTTFPVSTKQRCISIDGCRVELIQNEFNTKYLIIVTAIDKIGTVVSNFYFYERWRYLLDIFFNRWKLQNQTAEF